MLNTVTTGTRKKNQGKRNSTVTPIVIRHKSCLTDNLKSGTSFQVDNDDNDDIMEVVDSDLEEGEEEDVNDNGNGTENGNNNPGSTTIQAISPRKLGNNSLFWSSKPEGGMRDVLTVQCLKLNGEDFRTSKAQLHIEQFLMN